jgi:hypothetical protein
LLDERDRQLEDYLAELAASGGGGGGSGSLLAVNNLSDVANVATSRSNLGLGGAATLNVGTTAGTVAAGDDSRITGAAQKASNLSDLASATTARTNLGLGTSAVLNAPAAGNAAATEVVKGSDTRLTDARTPSAHAATHTAGGSDQITVAAGNISANVVDNTKLATVATATFKGRTTAGTGNVEDLSATQATALLNTFSSTLKGLAPSSGGGTANFLRADGTWAAPTATVGAGTVTNAMLSTAAGDWGGQWSSWTSTTFTNITGGVISGAYMLVGKTLFLRAAFTAGTVTATGTWSLTLPVLGTAAGRHLVYALQNTVICSGLIASGGTTITFAASNTGTTSTFGTGSSLTTFTFNGVINLA